jgi:hypothetical protein
MAKDYTQKIIKNPAPEKEVILALKSKIDFEIDMATMNS